MPSITLDVIDLTCLGFELDCRLTEPSSLDPIPSTICQLEERDVVVLTRLLVGSTDGSDYSPTILFKHVLCECH